MLHLYELAEAQTENSADPSLDERVCAADATRLCEHVNEANDKDALFLLQSALRAMMQGPCWRALGMRSCECVA